MASNGTARTVTRPSYRSSCLHVPDSHDGTSSVGRSGSTSPAYATPSRAYKARPLLRSQDVNWAHSGPTSNTTTRRPDMETVVAQQDENEHNRALVIRR